MTSEVLHLGKEKEDSISSAHRLIQRRYEIPKLSKKLQTFRELTFVEFLKELQKKNKALKKISLTDEQQLEERFISQTIQILDLQSQINILEERIDTMVFDLYELTEEERNLVLQNTV